MEGYYIDETEFIGRMENNLGNYYSEQSKKKFIEECRKLLQTSPQFVKLVKDKAFWDAFHVLITTKEGPFFNADKPSITIRMTGNDMIVSEIFSDSTGPVLQTYGLLFLDSMGYLVNRKVTEYANIELVHDLISEEHDYFEGIEYNAYEGHCRRELSKSGYAHGPMADPNLYLMNYGFNPNCDEIISRSRDSNSFGVYLEKRRWKDMGTNMEQDFLYLQDPQFPTIKMAPETEPVDVTEFVKSQTSEGKNELDNMRQSMSEEQLFSDKLSPLYIPFTKGRQR